eukprot:5182898-Pyramimonas_sp.AAC.1
MEQTLAMTEASVSFDVQRVAEWDRAPDRTVFSIGASRAMAPASVKAALSTWIVVSGVPTEQLVLHGGAFHNGGCIYRRKEEPQPQPEQWHGLGLSRPLLDSERSVVSAREESTLQFMSAPTRARGKHDRSCKLNDCNAVLWTRIQDTELELREPRASSPSMRPR